ncbi:MAG: dual specificity protein phosphatase family protein [Phycisphaerae bacterium]|jgi:protein tyrosine/serine phosphatase
MKKNKNKFAGWIVLALIIVASVGVVRHFRIQNFNTIKPDVLYTSGQPRGMDYTRLLYKYHIAAVVNIRNTTEHKEDNWHNEEITWVKNNGVKYIEMPIEKSSVANDAPDANVIEKFLAIMSEKNNLPVLVHDSRGKKRVAYLAAAWMLKSGGFTYEQTVKKIKKINDRPLDEEETNFLKSLAK